MDAAVTHRWDQVPSQRVAEGIARQMIVGERLMLCRITLAPRIDTPAHAHPHEQLTMIERGRVRFTIAGREHIASAGDVIHIPSDVVHGATMLDEEVVLVDIFTPIREDFLTT